MRLSPVVVRFASSLEKSKLGTEIRRKRFDDDVPSLTEFMRRAKVRKQFREYLRLARGLGDPSAVADMRRQIIDGFRATKDVVDGEKIQWYMSQGGMQLKQLETLVSNVANRRRSENVDKEDKIDSNNSPSPLGEEWPWERN
eukprot:g4446.t1